MDTLEEFYKSRLSKLNNVSDEIDSTIVMDPYLHIKNKNPIMIIGEAPGETEVAKGEPFCGPSGQNLNHLISFHGLSREQDFLITNIFPFRTRILGKDKTWVNRTPNSKELKIGSSILEEEIKIVKPRGIIILGGSALNGVRYIDELNSHFNEIKRGDIVFKKIYGFECGLGHSFHPSPIAYNRSSIRDSLFDFFQLIKESFY